MTTRSRSTTAPGRGTAKAKKVAKTGKAARTKAARTKAAPKRPRATVASVASSVDELQQSIDGLAAEVHELREEIAARQTPPGSTAASAALELRDGSPAELVRHLREVSDNLATSLVEAPTAADFQPLADHLYELAQIAPRLIERLESLPEVLGPLETEVWTKSATLSIFGRAIDIGAGTEEVRLYTDYSPTSMRSQGEAFSFDVPLSDGRHIIELKATDLAGNGATYTLVAWVEKDPLVMSPPEPGDGTMTSDPSVVIRGRLSRTEGVTVRVNPDIDQMLREEEQESILDLERRLGRHIIIQSKDDFHVEQYEIIP